jgi:hypothetical protein
MPEPPRQTDVTSLGASSTDSHESVAIVSFSSALAQPLAHVRPPSSRADCFAHEMARGIVYRLDLSQSRRPHERLAVDEWWIRDLADELGVGYEIEAFPWRKTRPIYST